MGLSIKNDDVERMARQLAAQRGVSITEAIRQSLADALDRGKDQAGPADRALRLHRLLAISERAAALPRLTDLTDDEILGYDEIGAPTR